MFSSLCFCPQRYFLLLMFWLLGKGALSICGTRMLYSYSTQKTSAHRCALGHIYLSWRRQSLRSPSQSHTASNMHTHAHRAHCTMLTSHFGLHMQLSNNRTVLSALFSPASLFCSTTPHPPTPASITSTTRLPPSKSLSFLLLITVVGPFELFKTARKDPQCSQKR